jgi:hypothetical protein
MATTITVVSDDEDDAVLIAKEVADHMAASGFKRILISDGNGAYVMDSVRQTHLQAARDTFLEMMSNPTLLDSIRSTRPDFFSEELIEVRTEPSVFAVAAPGQRLVADELVDADERNVLVSDFEMPGFKSRTAISEKLWKNYQNNPESLTPEERSLARYAESQGMSNIKVSTF